MKKVLMLVSVLALFGCDKQSEKIEPIAVEIQQPANLAEKEKINSASPEDEMVLANVDANEDKWFEEDYKKMKATHEKKE